MECRDRSAGDWGCGRDQFKLVGRPIRDADLSARKEPPSGHNRRMRLTLPMTLMTGVLLLFSCGISGAEHLTKACDELRLANEAIKVHDDAAIAAHLQAAKVHATEAVKNGDDKTWPNAVVVSAVLDKYP